MKDFGLIERRSQNITVINEKGKLQVYDNVVDFVINSFLDISFTNFNEVFD